MLVVCGVLFVAWYLLAIVVVCSLSVVVCCLLFVVCSLLFGVCSVFVMPCVSLFVC